MSPTATILFLGLGYGAFVLAVALAARRCTDRYRRKAEIAARLARPSEAFTANATHGEGPFTATRLTTSAPAGLSAKPPQRRDEHG